MSLLNEADTRAKLIGPRLKVALWGESQIEREHYFVKGQTITNGRIYLIGEESWRWKPRIKVDPFVRFIRIFRVTGSFLKNVLLEIGYESGLSKIKSSPL